MKVSLFSSGGFSGRRHQTTIDTDTLSRDDAQTLTQLAAAAKNENASSRPEPRDMGEQVSIEDSGQTVDLSMSAKEAARYPAFRALSDWLRAHARKAN